MQSASAGRAHPLPFMTTLAITEGVPAGSVATATGATFLIATYRIGRSVHGAIDGPELARNDLVRGRKPPVRTANRCAGHAGRLFRKAHCRSSNTFMSEANSSVSNGQPTSVRSHETGESTTDPGIGLVPGYSCRHRPPDTARCRTSSNP